jgi:phospholipase D-like protein
MFFSLWWIAAFILDIFALSDVMRSNRDTFSKVVLMVLILAVPFFAAGIYLLVFREKGYSV